ncbi:MAG: nucleotidyl transferase AbiEii/AbiGii toxin family protein [Terracidiphilus sp.]|nr:nucleotidyl transferase AbiEii/AbiGii toxin family protein [Terracidiphilus sp.]
MVSKQDILDRAAEWQLRPDVVEKDYALGWLLASLGTLPLKEQWIFKGGTAIKKCYFETYRFSEDLDFSLLPDAPYSLEEIRRELLGLAHAAEELSGIVFPADLVQVRERRNLQGGTTYEGKISYRGPLASPTPTPPRVLFDITHHEPLQEEPEERSVLHPYPDQIPDSGILVYSFHELLAEKARALYERTRPRDLYDVVFLLDNPGDALDLEQVRELFKLKCAVKSFAAPDVGEIVRKIQTDVELRTEWSNMLAHQLPALPELDLLLGRLPDLLGFLEEASMIVEEVQAAAVAPSAGEVLISPVGIRYWNVGAPLEMIRFAGSNRLMIEFLYSAKHRRAEPYSLRRAQSTGNLLLYAWEEASGQVKAFNVAKISSLRVTGQSFDPRYHIELSSGSPIRPASNTSGRTRSFGPSARRRTSRYGPTYIFQCPVCQKRFRHSKNDSTLRKHKNPSGWNCSGRRGYFIDMR